jgi:hypothetical protein
LEFETLTGEEVRNIVLHKRKPVRAYKPQAAAAAAAASEQHDHDDFEIGRVFKDVKT